MGKINVAGLLLTGAAVGCLDSNPSDSNLPGMLSSPVCSFQDFAATWKGAVTFTENSRRGDAAPRESAGNEDLEIQITSDGLPDALTVWPYSHCFSRGERLSQVGDVRSYLIGTNETRFSASVTLESAEFTANSISLVYRCEIDGTITFFRETGSSRLSFQIEREGDGVRYQVRRSFTGTCSNLLTFPVETVPFLIDGASEGLLVAE